jgi:hypothetical protein
MKNLRMMALIGVMAIVGSFAEAQGQVTRTWLSAVGDDANPCSVTAPCKTFVGAFAKTAADGEISLLDPGTFGIVTITRGVTINGNGVNGGISSGGVPNAITVNAAVTDLVILRNLSIQGMGTGTNGVRVISAGTVQVDHCFISNMTGRGIEVAATANVHLTVNDTIIDDCALDGIRMSTTTGQVVATIDSTRIQDCGSDGIEAIDRVRGAITNSVISHIASIGIRTSGTDSVLNIEHTFISNAATGVQGNAGLNTLRLSDSVISQNGTGLSTNGGTIESFQGNSLMGNGANGAFSGPATGKQ